MHCSVDILHLWRQHMCGNISWHTYAMHSVLPLKLGVTTPEPFSGVRTHPLAPLAQLRPQPNTLTLSLSLSACVPVELHRDPPPVPWPPSSICCDGTSQVIRPTYSCPCPTDLRQPCRCTWPLDRFGIWISFPFPRAFHSSRKHYNSSEIRKCRSSYNNLLLLKSKIVFNIYRPDHTIWVLSIIITYHGGGAKTSPQIDSKKF
jgi:hypothetical protein